MPATTVRMIGKEEAPPGVRKTVLIAGAHGLIGHATFWAGLVARYGLQKVAYREHGFDGSESTYRLFDRQFEPLRAQRIIPSHELGA